MKSGITCSGHQLKSILLNFGGCDPSRGWPHYRPQIGTQKNIKSTRFPDRSNPPPVFNQKCKNTIRSGDSLLVTDATTNPPALGLSTAERTGSPVLQVLWRIVAAIERIKTIYYHFRH